MTDASAPGLDELASERLQRKLASSPDPEGAPGRLARIFAANPGTIGSDHLDTVVALASWSKALSEHLARDPGLLHEDTGSVGRRLRAALIQVAGEDLSGHLALRDATAALSARVDRIVADTLAGVVADLEDRHPILGEMPFAVIAMGKWGATELNYYSDIDMVFVYDGVGGREAETREAARSLASRLVANLSMPALDGTSFNVDTDLRPEGSAGPLCRSLDSYAAYYGRWAEPWELQALIKARAAAGDPELGSRFEELASSTVWERGLDVESLRSVRQIKARVEETADPLDLKRSRGGIRDIEFTVQLLQLVHGRFDQDLRVRSTLDAVAALSRHGYIAPDDEAKLVEAYTFLRDVEHRIQLWDLEQTHVVPSDDTTRRRLGRGLGLEADYATSFDRRLAEVRSQVRDLHERLYFRPILDSLAGIPSALIDQADASLRLEALGFRDTLAASSAFSELTAGLSRRSRAMQQVLPLTLDWLSLAPDPDLGLAQLRLLLAKSTDHSALVTLLQGNPLAGERLCRLLGTGRLLGDLMDRIPEFVPRLADDASIADIRDLREATIRLTGLIDSRPGPDAKVGTIRRFVRRRKLRIAARDVLGEAPPALTLRSLSDTADAAVTGALGVVTGWDPTGFGIVAMGKWGGQELSYGSDIDLIYVRGDAIDQERALSWASSMSRVLSEPNKHGEAYELDAGLRPEGRSGPLVRGIDSYRRYYNEWAQPWEMLAMVKARPAAGDASVLTRFMETVQPLLWSRPLTEELAREIRSIKARVEAERIPLDEDPDFHLKLGPGGLSDVEFVTQLLQLRHGPANDALRVTGTLDALRRLREAELVSAGDFNALHDSYLFCTRVRMRLHLQQGRAADSLPTDPQRGSQLAVSLGFDRVSEMREQYRRYTRRARRTFEALFFS